MRLVKVILNGGTKELQRTSFFNGCLHRTHTVDQAYSVNGGWFGDTLGKWQCRSEYNSYGGDSLIIDVRHTNGSFDTVNNFFGWLLVISGGSNCSSSWWPRNRPRKKVLRNHTKLVRVSCSLEVDDEKRSLAWCQASKSLYLHLISRNPWKFATVLFGDSGLVLLGDNKNATNLQMIIRHVGNQCSEFRDYTTTHERQVSLVSLFHVRHVVVGFICPFPGRPHGPRSCITRLHDAIWASVTPSFEINKSFRKSGASLKRTI